MNGSAAGTGAWSSGLFELDYFDDCGLCCLTLWCPCITFGKVAFIVDKEVMSPKAGTAAYFWLGFWTGCPWILSCAVRAKLRARYGLPEAPCGDCCVHFWCEPCALVQEYKELKARGYDPHMGWQLLNVENGDGSAPGVETMGR